MDSRRIPIAAILFSLGLSACSGESVKVVSAPAVDSSAVATTPIVTAIPDITTSAETETLPAPAPPAGAIPGEPVSVEPAPVEAVAPVPAPAPVPVNVVPDPAPEIVLNDDWWQPKASDNLTWQWQLQGEVDVTFPVDVYNVDIEIPQQKLDRLIEHGIKVICYFSAGTVESFRADAELFAQDIVGEQYEDLVDEKWVDYANIDALAPIMRARLDKCAEKGFHAVEIDNVDAHNYESRDANGNVTNIGTNFNMTLDESIAYVRWLTNEAHSRGLGIGLKNAEEMVPDVVDEVDWMLVEDCYFDSWCNAATAFIDANKPVFMAEYDDLVPDFAPACELAKALGFSAIWRDPGLSNRLYLACE